MLALTLYPWAVGSFLLHPSSVLNLFEGRVQLGMGVEGVSHGRRYCELAPLCRTTFSLSQRMGWEKYNSLAWPVLQSQVLHNLSLQLKPLLICLHTGPQPGLWASPDLRQEGFKDLALTPFCYPCSFDLGTHLVLITVHLLFLRLSSGCVFLKTRPSSIWATWLAAQFPGSLAGESYAAFRVMAKTSFLLTFLLPLTVAHAPLLGLLNFTCPSAPFGPWCVWGLLGRQT